MAIVAFEQILHAFAQYPRLCSINLVAPWFLQALQIESDTIFILTAQTFINFYPSSGFVNSVVNRYGTVSSYGSNLDGALLFRAKRRYNNCLSLWMCFYWALQCNLI